MARIGIATLAFVLLIAIDLSNCMNHVPADEWNQYKIKYQKSYPNLSAEALAQYYYAYNMKLIEKHNALFRRGQRTYSLSRNQFTDMHLIHFKALFPATRQLSQSNASPPPTVSAAPPAYNPFTGLGFSFRVEDQGTKCNSGWSYAAAKSVEILKAGQTGNQNPAPLSAQNLIDCAGTSTACQSQVAQSAFDYLTLHDMALLTELEYRNNNSLAQPGMCLASSTTGTKLLQYSTLVTDDDSALRAYVGAGYPVIVEINPTTFEFMHYDSGIFQPTKTLTKGSHFLLVVGYDTDATTGLDYWILQNSFSTNWGEQGLMRIVRSASVKLTKNPIFPLN